MLKTDRTSLGPQTQDFGTSGITDKATTACGVINHLLPPFWKVN